MNTGKWQVHINRPINSLGAELTIFRRIGEKTEVIEIGGMGRIFIKQLEESGKIKQPTMSIGYEEDLRGILAAFVEAGATFGVKRPEGAFAEGKLEALEAHLGDMRRLVFKDEVK